MSRADSAALLTLKLISCTSYSLEYTSKFQARNRKKSQIIHTAINTTRYSKLDGTTKPVNISRLVVKVQRSDTATKYTVEHSEETMTSEKHYL
jgi:hypothetical protein